MILFEKEKETLLIPLYGKAIKSMKKSSILLDSKAIGIVEKIDYYSKSLEIPAKTYTMMSLRTKLIDNFVKDYLRDKKISIILHLSCGLDK